MSRVPASGTCPKGTCSTQDELALEHKAIDEKTLGWIDQK